MRSSPKTWPASVQGLKLITQITKFQLPGTLPRRMEGRANQQQATGRPWESLLFFHAGWFPVAQLGLRRYRSKDQGMWSVLGSQLPVFKDDHL